MYKAEREREREKRYTVFDLIQREHKGVRYVGAGDGCIHLLSNMAATRHTSPSLALSLSHSLFLAGSFHLLIHVSGLCEVRRQAAGGGERCE